MLLIRIERGHLGR